MEQILFIVGILLFIVGILLLFIVGILLLYHVDNNSNKYASIVAIVGMLLGTFCLFYPQSTYGNSQIEYEENTVNSLVSLRTTSSTEYNAYGISFILAYVHVDSEEKDYYEVYVKDEDGDIRKVRLPANDYSLRLTDAEAPCIKEKVAIKYAESSHPNIFPRRNIYKHIEKRVLVVPTNTIKIENTYEAK